MTQVPLFTAVVRTSRDRALPLQSHLDELAARGQLLLLTIVTFAVVWAFLVDGVLSSWLDLLPIAPGEMTVYSPHRWLQLRWGLVGLLALLSASPLIAHQFLRFVEPGALPREMRLARTLVVAALVTMALAIPVLWVQALPYGFAAAERSSLPTTIARYDASLIFEVALGLSWATVIMVIACISQFAGRISGVMGEPGEDSMRFRLHLVALFTLWIVLPPTLETLWPTFALLTVLASEGVAHIAPDRALHGWRKSSPRLDSEGAEHRVAILDCRCEGACPTLPRSDAPDHVALLGCQALCLDREAQDLLLDAFLDAHWSRLVITGCDGSPPPARLRRQFEEHGCQIVGARWLERAGVPAGQSDQLGALCRNLSLDALVHPWDLSAGEASQKRRMDAISELDLECAEERTDLARIDAEGWSDEDEDGTIPMPKISIGPGSRGGGVEAGR